MDGVIVYGGEIEFYVGGELVQILLGVPAEAVTGGEAARQHVVLEHVIQADPQAARQQYGDQSQHQGNDVDTKSKGSAAHLSRELTFRRDDRLNIENEDKTIINTDCADCTCNPCPVVSWPHGAAPIMRLFLLWL